MNEIDLSQLQWYKSSFSSANGQCCMRLMQNPNYSQSGVRQGLLSRKLATRRVK